MRRRVGKLYRFLDMNLTEEQKAALQIADKYTIQYIDEIIKIAQISYFVPKLMDYYIFFIDDENNTITFTSDKVKVIYNRNEVMEEPSRVAKELQIFRNKSYRRDFIKEAQSVVAELLENVVELNTLEVAVIANKVVVSQDDFVDLLSRLSKPIFLKIKG